MKFAIKKLILWMNDEAGYIRELEFEENKINVISGESNTGKTAILHIVDYCLFSSKHKIAESKINENVAWYGLNFLINDKHYTIARKAPHRATVSGEYYFSSVGELPKKPSSNMTESALKELLETEFNIDKDVTIPFGGKALKANSKISLRYFMLFCTISGDIVQHSEVFFDKQSDNRYREALPRVFDLAVGIETVDNIIRRDKLVSLQAKLAQIKRKNEKISAKKSEFHEELQDIAMEAKEYGLIEEGGDTPDSISALQSVIDDGISNVYKEQANRRDQIESEKSLLERRIRNLERFQSTYSEYKSSLGKIEDSLKPVEYWQSKKEIVKTSIFELLIDSLEDDLLRIKQLNKNRTPIDGKTSDEIARCKVKIEKLEDEARKIPREAKSFKDERDKLLFLGQTKSKLDIYAPEENERTVIPTSEIEEQIKSIQVNDTSENRELTIKVLEEIIQGYMELVKTSLENYGDYLPVFNYKDKKLDFRKPKSTYIEAAGSSSNDMFKHLFMFLGLHELILENEGMHVPSLLLIDQPSRPYYGEENNLPETRLEPSDRAKIKDALRLLDSFMENVLTEMDLPFQMIVFEHIPTDYFEGLEHFNLLKEFRNGNALVPQKYFDSLNYLKF